MKVIIYHIIVFLFTSIASTAQTQYESGMNQAFDHWKNNRPVEAANLFERIAKAEKDNWLPYYYASQVKIIESFPMTNVAQKDQLISDAQQLLDSAKTHKGEEVELMVLQAMLHTARLTIDPSTYGMKLSPVITKIYGEALQKAPENPRVVLSKAEWDMGSAKFFGEDPAAYCPDLEKSLQLFASEEDISPLTAPAWGEDRALMLLKDSCNKD